MWSGSVTSRPVIWTDYYTTPAEIVGVDIASDVISDGASFIPVLTGTGEILPQNLVWHFQAYLEAFRLASGALRTTAASVLGRGTYKLIHWFEDGCSQLYDLSPQNA